MSNTSRIQSAFKNKKAFIGFVTAGDPSIEKSEEFILEMVRAGTDLIEIGIPFSDPIAEGKVIEAANVRALRAGTTVEKVFELVRSLRRKTDVPLVFLTYLNPVLNAGYDKFFARCGALGVDGIIIPDLPFEEKREVKDYAKQNGVDIISMVTPTSHDRIVKIAADASGFIYVVSSMGVTGVRDEISTDLSRIIREIRSVSIVPAAVGFGVYTPEQARKIAALADGVIVGSAIVSIIGKYGENAAASLYAYCKAMKDAVN